MASLYIPRGAFTVDVFLRVDPFPDFLSEAAKFHDAVLCLGGSVCCDTGRQFAQ